MPRAQGVEGWYRCARSAGQRRALSCRPFIQKKLDKTTADLAGKNFVLRYLTERVARLEAEKSDLFLKVSEQQRLIHTLEAKLQFEDGVSAAEDDTSTEMVNDIE